jgi:hypothetical protein
MAACSQPSPSPPPNPDPGSTGPSLTQRITGAERIAWDQRAGSAEDLATFHYLVYVDGEDSPQRHAMEKEVAQVVRPADTVR